MTISAINGQPLPSTDATLCLWSGDAASNSGAVADGCLTWQERVINGREEARARVDEVMLSSWLSLIGPSCDRDHNTSFVGGWRRCVRACAHVQQCVSVCVHRLDMKGCDSVGLGSSAPPPPLFYSLQTREAPAMTACLRGKPGHP